MQFQALLGRRLYLCKGPLNYMSKYIVFTVYSRGMKIYLFKSILVGQQNCNHEIKMECCISGMEIEVK